MSAIVVAVATACGFVTAALAEPWSRPALVACLFAALSWRVTDWKRHSMLTISWTIPVIVPLGIIHGVLNPAFPSSAAVGPIPIRVSGLEYAAVVTAKLLLVAVVVVAWRGVRRTQLLALAQTLRLPNSVVVVLAATSSALSLVEQRIDAVVIAQQARGLLLGPGLKRRLAALSAIAVPVITTTLVEASHRGSVVGARGLGQVPLASVGPLEVGWTVLVRVVALVGITLLGLVP